MELDDFIITVFCEVDDRLKVFGKLRQRGPQPTLADSEVLTMELVGEFLGLDTDKALYSYFRRHYRHFFPTLRHVHRTTFARQAANLWLVKTALWHQWGRGLPGDRRLRLLDSVPIPVCRFARAPCCKRFRGQAAFGYDELERQTFYGFRFHLSVELPGLTRTCSLAPANVHELHLVPELTEGFQGVALGDRNYWSPTHRAALAEVGIDLQAPFKTATHDPDPQRSRWLTALRRRIETVIGQLVERYHLKKVWARDLWHLCSRIWRKLLSHTVAMWVNIVHGRSPLQLEGLVTA